MKKSTRITLCFLCSVHMLLNGQMRIDATFYSQALQTAKNVDIYLPDDYYQNPDTKYPVIYYLHGAGGDQNESAPFAYHYFTTHAASSLSDSVPAAIVVSPDGSCGLYLGSYWVNSVLYGNYEDYVISDVIAFIESEFRVMPDKNFRFVTGYSMGGYGSAHMALKHPDKFRACAPMSAAHLSYPDTLMNEWLDRLYEENGSYHFTYGAGPVSKLFFTASGGFSPNLNINPYYVESLWDTTGMMVDTVRSKWQNYNCSKIVSSLSPEEKLSFFLICGTEDQYVCYPPYLMFSDSLEKYNINYRSMYNAYEHGPVDLIANAAMWRWIDSLAFVAYKSVGVEESLIHSEKTLRIWPNPAFSTAIIEYELKEQENVLVSILNSTGQEVLHFAEGLKEKGKHTLKWGSGDFPNGIYFINLKTKEGVLTQKVIKR